MIIYKKCQNIILIYFTTKVDNHNAGTNVGFKYKKYIKFSHLLYIVVDIVWYNKSVKDWKTYFMKGMILWQQNQC